MIESSQPVGYPTQGASHPDRPGVSTDLRGTSPVVINPIDRVRWGPIMAGLFATLATLAVLTTLGLAIGFTALDANDRPGDFGLGGGIWAILTALVAFFVGGWFAARSAVVAGSDNGVLQGAVVWMVTIGLLMYLLAGGVGSLFRAASNAANTAANVASNSSNEITNASRGTGNAVDQAASGNVDAAGRQLTDSANRAADNIRNNISNEDVNRAASAAARGAWGTLASMLLGLAAACAGGYVGAQNATVSDDRRLGESHRAI